MLILVQKRPKNDFFDSVLILVQKTKKTRFFQKFCHFLKIHEKSRFLEQIVEIFVIFFLPFLTKKLFMLGRAVYIYVWKKFPVRGFPVLGSPVPAFVHPPCSLYRDSLYLNSLYQHLFNPRGPSTGILQKKAKNGQNR